jgi:type II secretory pathway pseudopilin PulG
MGVVMVRAESTYPGGRRRADGGFTLIESLLAAAILLVVSAAIITVLVATATWYASARTQAQATSVAHEVMALIQARAYTEIQVSAAGVWPSSIPAQMETETPAGRFAIETTIAPATDPTTQLAMTRIEVAVTSLDRTMTPISLIAFASNTAASGADRKVYVPVKVVCVPGSNISNSTVLDANPDASYNNAGTPVQLRNIDNMDEVAYTALTDASNVAFFPAVAVGQYWLTSEPSYPVVHAMFFPIRISPAAGGTSNNPVLSLNEYNLGVTQPNASSAYQATLRVGAYRSVGWYFGGIVGGVHPFSAPTPYQPVTGLVVHAQPMLNTMDPGYFGSGALSRYPDNTNMVYSATVNGFGVAVINIPWTLDPLEGQYWKVWATTTTRSTTNPYTLFTSIPGDWTNVVNQPERPSTAQNQDIPQFQYVTGDPTQ